MPQKKNQQKSPSSAAATVGYEAELWRMADALRGSMDAAEYKHVVLGLIFLKYISDAFEEQHAKLEADKTSGADPEDPDEYRALSIFWVPPEARWSHLKAQARQPTIGRLVDDAMASIDGQITHGDTFHNDRHPDLKADFILANPPFNVSDWGGERLRDDKRWKYGVPPVGNANFAWVQHIVHHLAPAGVAGFVLANGSMSSNQSGEGEIRKNLIEADLVDCMVALPGQLFYSTQIPACLWFIARDKRGQPSPRPAGHPSPNGRGDRGEGYRNRRGSVLFIDARKLGRMVDRTHRELTDEDIARIANTYHAWRGESVGAGLVPAHDRATVGAGLVPAPDGATTRVAPTEYRDIEGFCRSVTIEEIRKHGHVLTPGRYVGVEAQEDDGEPFEQKMQRLVAQLREQQAEAAKLDAAIAANLKELGYGG